MAANSTADNEIKITEAQHSDLDSLSTILARSFHPVNPYIKKCLPDTPSVREWWTQLFRSGIDSLSSRILIASTSTPNQVVGVLILGFMQADEKGAGNWTKHAPSPDIDTNMFTAMIDNMITQRERLMLGRRHFLVELLAVDHEYKGRGLGRRLLARACELVDESGRECFVQANRGARGFYEREGFVLEAEVGMPKDGEGEEEYVECLLVRPGMRERR